MKKTSKKRIQSVLSLRISPRQRAAVDTIAGTLTVKRSKFTSLTDVLLEALADKAAKEGVPWPKA